VIWTALLMLAQQPSPGNLDHDVPGGCSDDPDVCAAALAAVEAVEAGTSDECDDPQAQQVMNMCAARDFESADAALNEQWDLTVAVMKEADAERGRDDGQPGYYDTLLEGQRGWLLYRDAQCLSESFEARGGSMQPMLELFCKTYLTELRTEQLRALVAGPAY
jgi:uncharacterized protein YecT (DUF1311 family)